MPIRYDDNNRFVPPIFGLAPQIGIPPTPGPEGVAATVFISVAVSAWFAWNVLKSGDVNLLEKYRLKREQDKQFEQLMYEFERRGFSRLDAIRLAHASVSWPTSKMSVTSGSLSVATATPLQGA